MSPLKIFEYMASKKAIVASDLPVLREILSETNAILVAPDDLEAWKDAIRKLKDNTLRKKLGSAAHKAFRSKYTWDIRARNVIS
jgi:glycosyltransferase involved in cell wall biosynthesis